MVKRTGSLRLIVPGFALVALSSCAFAPLAPQQRIGRTPASFDAVFQASMEAVIEANFAVTSADPKTGLIVGERSVVFGRGESTRVNVLVSDAGATREVKASVIYAPGSMVVGGSAVDVVMQALKKRLPDMQVVTP